jgi:hypothetical protein
MDEAGNHRAAAKEEMLGAHRDAPMLAAETSQGRTCLRYCGAAGRAIRFEARNRRWRGWKQSPILPRRWRLGRNALHASASGRHHRARLGVGLNAGAGDLAPLIAAAFPDRLAQRSEPGSFRFSGGGGAKLAVTDPLAKAGLLAAAMDMKTSPLIRMAAPLDIARLPVALTAQIKELGDEPRSISEHQARRRGASALVLEESSAPADAVAAAAVLLQVVRSDPSHLPWTDAARNLQARLKLMHGLEPDIWPASNDESLISGLENWLGPHLQGLTRLADLAVLVMLSFFCSNGWTGLSEAGSTRNCRRICCFPADGPR